MDAGQIAKALVAHWDALGVFRHGDDSWSSDQVRKEAASLSRAAREELVLELEARACSPQVTPELRAVWTMHQTNLLSELPDPPEAPEETREPAPALLHDYAAFLIQWWAKHPRVGISPAPLWPNESARERARKFNNPDAERLIATLRTFALDWPQTTARDRLRAQATALMASFMVKGYRFAAYEQGHDATLRQAEAAMQTQKVSIAPPEKAKRKTQPAKKKAPPKKKKPVPPKKKPASTKKRPASPRRKR